MSHDVCHMIGAARMRRSINESSTNSTCSGAAGGRWVSWLRFPLSRYKMKNFGFTFWF